MRKYVFILSVVLLLIPLSLGIVSFFYTPYPITEMDIDNRFSLMSKEHLLGTDQFGRDILSRLMVASRYALLLGTVSVTLGLCAGVFIGVISALSNKWISMIFLRFIDGMLAFPGIVLAMMFVVVFGDGLYSTLIAIAIFMIPIFARLTYSLIKEQQHALYIVAAKSMGLSTMRIVWRHYLPVILPRLVTQFSASIGSAILIESALSYLGLGVVPPNASFGLMLKEAQSFMLSYPYLILPSGILLVITVLGLNLMGDTLNDRLMKLGDTND
ncbi:ABC transporter permease [Nosocomiicoccus ampullae]|uniref:ABC transporter permease n=1 Tax=Nosocomiicoccus ampullae TaxID=489910 RepID=UPI002551819A|nr:ABC transporter permease [Nosocomiicoccus ampullae]MDK6863063.1 ABC transporter permease [Nosocomiicoccus ampullae]